MLPTTKTDIAKMCVSMVVSAKAADAAEHVAVDRFDANPDNLVVEVGTKAFGAYVALKTRPLTDKAVDKTVSKFQSWRENRKNNAE